MRALRDAHPALHEDTIRKAVSRLIAAGYVRKEGGIRSMRYWAVGDMPPEDLRGKCGRSYVGRSRGAVRKRVIWAHNLHPLQAAMGYGL
jgi:hypothetical protein